MPNFLRTQQLKKFQKSWFLPYLGEVLIENLEQNRFSPSRTGYFQIATGRRLRYKSAFWIGLWK
jgi:hypothetical protein